MKRLWLIALILILLGGCQTGGVQKETETSQMMMPQEEETVKINDSDFVADVTIPDNSFIDPGEAFVKTWRIRNTGDTTWKDYKFVFTRGDQLGAPDSVNVPETEPGESVNIDVKMKAPEKFGTYTGWWQMQSDEGDNFGDLVWVLIKVGKP